MKKKTLLATILLIMIAVFAFSLTACNKELESLQNEYGIVVDGGSFEEGSTLVSNEIVATTEEAAEVTIEISMPDNLPSSYVNGYKLPSLSS